MHCAGLLTENARPASVKLLAASGWRERHIPRLLYTPRGLFWRTFWNAP